jgi:mono/diheme cytochrome c family protein
MAYGTVQNAPMQTSIGQILLCAFFLSPMFASAASESDQPRRGEYLYRAAGCGGCHTAQKGGAEGAGGLALCTPFGVFHTPNITPDPETGIGRWREEDLSRALRHGVNPDGAHYYPAFPYASYTSMTDADVGALWAYLRTLKPVRRANTAHELPWYLRVRTALLGWKILFFTPGPFKADSDKSPLWNRGAYLVGAVTHCGECHTPRNMLGGLRRHRALAGTREQGPDGASAPNITPDSKTGIGRWSEGELVEFLKTGMTPGGDFAGNAMAEVIERSTAILTPEDRRAIAVYVLSLPPIENDVRKKKKREKQDFE